MKNMINNTMYTVQEIHIFPQSFSGITFKVPLKIILFPSVFSRHSSTNVSTNLFMQLQFL